MLTSLTSKCSNEKWKEVIDKYQKAVTKYEKAIKINPKYDDAKKNLKVLKTKLETAKIKKF